MDTKRTYQGKWWLPDNADLCISGTLEIVQGDQALLDLHGSFHGDHGFHDECPELIHGISLDGNKFSLYKCLYQSSEHTGGGARYRYIACYVIIGKYLRGVSDLALRKVSFEYSYLNDWISKTGIIYDKCNQANTLSITAKQLDSIIYKINDKITVSVDFQLHYSTILAGITICQNVYLTVKSSECMPFKTWQNNMMYFRDLMTLFIGRPITPLNIRGYSDVPFDVIMPHIVQPYVTDSLHPRRMLISHGEVEALFGDILKKWLKFRVEMDDVLNLYFSIYHNDSLYMEYQLLVSCLR